MGQLVIVFEPVWQKSRLSTSLTSSPETRPLTPVLLGSLPRQRSTEALIKSGSDANLIDVNLASKLNLDLQFLSRSLQVRSLNNQLLHQVKLVTRHTALAIDNHSETAAFHVIESPSQPLDLGYLTQPSCPDQRQ